VGILATIGTFLGGAWASGINLYLTVATLGIANKAGFISLPESLQVLSDPLVITVAVILFLIEFFADKIPYVDSAWDSMHTIIRPVGAALLAFMGTENTDIAVQFSVTLACAAVAMDSHLTKASARAVINTSPEPFSNIIASFSEDIVVLSVLFLIVKHPVIAGIGVILFILFSFWFLRGTFRFLKRAFSFAAERTEKEKEQEGD